jgi:hypothetical protein
MGHCNHLGTHDRRSQRNSRGPGFDMILMRTVPREPVRPPPTVAIDAPSVTNLLLRVPAFLWEAEDELSRHVEHTARDGQFHTYIDELTEAEQCDLLCYGAYVLSEAGYLRRVLYIGGAAATMVRHRVTDHLAFRGGKRLMRQALRYEFEEQLKLPHHKEDTRPYELALRRALFSCNQWSGVPEDLLTEQQRYAVEVIASGAFEISYVAFPKRDRLLARALEVFLLDSVFTMTGALPLLNAVPAIITEDTLKPSPSDCITMQQLARIVSRVKSAARVL